MPSVAIIGTAKAGTTDLYTLLTRTSHLAPGLERTRKFTWAHMQQQRARCQYTAWKVLLNALAEHFMQIRYD
jgi:hypothetical protein